MSDISDGPSGAARRAQNNESKKTFFKKLFTSKEPSKTEAEEQSNNCLLYTSPSPRDS